MDQLIKNRLFGAGLVRLTPHLVERYNKCLISAGLEPTKLEEIDVDGVGASPQVAQEKGDPHYLCNGFANPIAIIVSPDQYDKPSYYPIFSWQRTLMRAFFEKSDNAKRIRDITGTDGFVIDLEDGLSTFQGAEDLLLLTEITAVPHVEELAEAAQRQSELIATFMDGPPTDPSCLREEVCDSLGEHRHHYGDLRKRKVIMSPITFDSFADFWTVAFGGAAVLRHIDGVDFLVLQSQEEFDKLNKKRIGSAHAYCLEDPDTELFTKLEKANCIQVPVQRFQGDPQLLEFKKELLLADALCDCEERTDWRNLSPAARKALINRHKDRIPEIYFELERFAAGLKNGRRFNCSKELKAFLWAPATNLPPGTQEVLWILLTRREPRSLLDLYTVDKNAFLQRYQQWSEQKRAWAASYLAARYKHHHRILAQ